MATGRFCPLLRKDCIESKCSWYIQIRGNDPNTGNPVDKWDCAVAWAPTLFLEIAQKTNQAGAAVESFRNEVVKGNKENQQLYVRAISQGIVPAQITQLNLIEAEHES